MAKRSRATWADRVLTDPVVIRALAHPARITVLEELSNNAQLTATECARLTGLSASAMSYHLRALEKYGFVERAVAEGDGRERPWRATASGWRIGGTRNVAVQHATRAVLGVMFDQIAVEMQRWDDREAEQPEEWRSVGVMNNSVVWLTADEARELTAAYLSITQKARGRNDTRTKQPAGARRVRLNSFVIPAPE